LELYFSVPDGTQRFPNINISQGSVATHLRWGGIFINNANFQPSTSVNCISCYFFITAQT